MYWKQEVDTESTHSQLSDCHGLVEYVVMCDASVAARSVGGVLLQVLALNVHFDRVCTCIIPSYGEHVTDECSCTFRQTTEENTEKTALNLICRAGAPRLKCSLKLSIFLCAPFKMIL